MQRGRHVRDTPPPPPPPDQVSLGLGDRDHWMSGGEGEVVEGWVCVSH